MRRGPIFGGVLLLACAMLLAGTASAATAAPAKPRPHVPYPVTGFELEGSNGYTIIVSAFLQAPHARGRISVTAIRGKEVAGYLAAAKVTSDSMRANLGRLGRVNLTLHRSGQEETLHSQCLNEPETFEPGTYEGIFEFHGEGGYTDARATQAAGLPEFDLFLGAIPCGEGEGTGETFSPNLPGARLKAISYAGGRTLKYQINKNRPGGDTLFTASLAERRDGIRIYREISGTAPASAFHYDARVRTATLDPPAPFSGTAHLRRNPNSVSPLLTGNLALTFPGRTVDLAGPAVHVSLEHARITHGDGASITVGI